MSDRKKEVSGWYVRPKVTPAQREEIQAWYEKRLQLNCRSLSAEIPGKMMLELGKLAQQRGVPFNDLIEGILGEYLERQGISWRK